MNQTQALVEVLYIVKPHSNVGMHGMYECIYDIVYRWYLFVSFIPSMSFRLLYVYHALGKLAAISECEVKVPDTLR